MAWKALVETFLQVTQTGEWTQVCRSFLTVLLALAGSRQSEKRELATLLRRDRMILASATDESESLRWSDAGVRCRVAPQNVQIAINE